MVSDRIAIDTATDNDIILKAACYGLTDALWSNLGRMRQVGVLGAARYVLTRAIDRATLLRDKEEVRVEAFAFLDAATVLEPTKIELTLAAEMEALAQRQALALDAGESQLAAMTTERAITALETGDKRAVNAYERLLDHLEALAPLAGRVRCLEQLLLRLVTEGEVDAVARAICTEPHVDKAMSICFGCYSQESTSKETVLAGLASYIEDARRDAPHVLAA
jgi:hypothetical protein